MDLKEEAILGDAAASHWYYISKGAALLRFIKGIKAVEVLDIGAGSGIFAKLLLRRTGVSRVVCCDTGYSRERVEHCAEKPLYFKKEIEHSEAGLALFLDVLEHVEDDVLFVQEYAKKLKSGTYVAVTVPAFQFLFSGHDLFLDHYRRYTIASLEKCLSAAGLKVLKSRYYFFFLFPAIALVRLISKIRLMLFHAGSVPQSDLRPYGKAINALLVLINRAELAVFPFNRIAGITIFSLAVKQ
jgi:trans-aconitate methyltransferase